MNKIKLEIQQIYENKKCKKCDDGCVGCYYFHKKIIPKIEKYKNKNSLK